jgi:Fuc2NAc and GlcNAc transferase
VPTDSRLWVSFLSFCLALGTTELARSLAQRMGMLDHPTSRSSHRLPTPRGGGLAIVLGFMLAICVFYYLGLIGTRLFVLFLLGCGSVALVGYIDDLHSISAWSRFCVHLCAAVIAVGLIGDSSIPIWLHMGSAEIWIVRGFGVLAIAWGTNLFNFMDGIDGLAGSEAIFVGASGAWLTHLYAPNTGLEGAMLCLAAACAGFLILNWPPAKIFMGDVGSSFLGFTLVVLGWASSSQKGVRFEVWIILAGVFVVDASLTLCRRVVRGDRWFDAHRMHAYQHLARGWGSHLRVTSTIAGVNVLWLLPWAWFAADHPQFAAQSLLVSLAPLAGLAIVAGSGRREK